MLLKNHKCLIITIFIFFLAEPNRLFAQNVLTDSTHYSNGQPVKKGKYKYKKRHGIWLYYFPNGYIMRKEKWQNGKLTWQIKYDIYKRKLYGVNQKGDTTFYKGCNCTN